MNPTQTGKVVALLVSNGFDEHQMAEVQRTLAKAKITARTVAPETGVVNGWQGEGWGHYFPVDASISSALGSDFDLLVLPGGERSAARLTSNAHARRIINHFLEAKKPIAAIGSGVGLLALPGTLGGIELAAETSLHAALTQAGAVLSSEPQVIHDHVLSADGSDLASFTASLLEMVDDVEITQEAA